MDLFIINVTWRTVFKLPLVTERDRLMKSHPPVVLQQLLLYYNAIIAKVGSYSYSKDEAKSY